MIIQSIFLVTQYNFIDNMSRSKQKLPKNIPEDLGQATDKRINEYCLNIKESKGKLEDYINVINNRIGLIISNRLNKFVVMHSQVVGEKDHEIKVLEEENEKTKLSHISANIEKLERTIIDYEKQIQRINNIKEMFRKQSQRFKIELDIKEKQLDACKKREKKLIRKIWVLQEDIKDIYSYDHKGGNNHAKNIVYSTPQKGKHVQQNNQGDKFINRTKTKVINTEKSLTEAKNNLKIKIQDRYIGYKCNIHEGSTELKDKFSISSQEQARLSNSFRSITSHHRSHIKNDNLGPIIFRTKQFDIYNDLRKNLRKASRNKQTPPYYEQKDKQIKVQDYKTICLQGPRIIRQIQKVVIDNHGQLKEIDEYSLELLNKLFKSQNAIKILEIVLFNFTHEAIDNINDNKKILINENHYQFPENEENMSEKQQKIDSRMVRPKKIKMEDELKKKFKHTLHNRKTQLYSSRGVYE